MTINKSNNGKGMNRASLRLKSVLLKTLTPAVQRLPDKVNAQSRIKEPVAKI